MVSRGRCPGLSRAAGCGGWLRGCVRGGLPPFPRAGRRPGEFAAVTDWKKEMPSEATTSRWSATAARRPRRMSLMAMTLAPACLAASAVTMICAHGAPHVDDHQDVAVAEGVGAGGEVDAAAVLQGDGVAHGGAQVGHDAGGAGEGAQPDDGDGLGGGHGRDGCLGVVGRVGVQRQAQILDVVVERIMQRAAVLAVLRQGVLGGDHHQVAGAQFPLEVGPAAVAQVLGRADHGGVVDVGALGDLGDVRVGGELRIAGDDIDHPALGLGQRNVRKGVAEPGGCRIGGAVAAGGLAGRCRTGHSGNSSL